MGDICFDMETLKKIKKSALNFKPIKNATREELNFYLNTQEYRICDYTFGVLYMWSPYLNYTYAVSHNMLIISSALKEKVTFSIPIGNGDIHRALDDIDLYCKENNLSLNFHGVTEDAVKLLKKHFGNRFEINNLENWGEYLYNYEDLLYLRGKKYHSKRNHINQFLKNYPEYEFKKITEWDIPRIKEFLTDYYNKTKKEYKLFKTEKEMLSIVLKDYEKLCLCGGYIEVKGKVVAFAMGEIQRDTMYVHIEKADRDYKGSYAIINRDFLKYFQSEKLKYVNREEDAGDLGLRKAKKSYNPVEIIKKYSVKEKAL